MGGGGREVIDGAQVSAQRKEQPEVREGDAAKYFVISHQYISAYPKLVRLHPEGARERDTEG